MTEVAFIAKLKDDGWKLKDSFCGVYLYISKDKKFQIIYNVMTSVVKVTTGDLMNEIVWKGTLEEFSGFTN